MLKQQTLRRSSFIRYCQHLLFMHDIDSVGAPELVSHVEKISPPWIDLERVVGTVRYTVESRSMVR